MNTLHGDEHLHMPLLGMSPLGYLPILGMLSPLSYLPLLGMSPRGPSLAWFPTKAACHHSSSLALRRWMMSPCLKERPSEGQSSSLVES